MTKIIFRVQTQDGYRIIILPHSPDNGGDMVDVVELSDKKQVHGYGFKVLGSGFKVLGSEVHRFRVQPRRRPKKRPVKSKKKLICLLFNPGPAIEAASLIIKKIVPFWPSFIQAPPLAASVQSDRKRNSEKANIE
jgi:hypothetical protein